MKEKNRQKTKREYERMKNKTNIPVKICCNTLYVHGGSKMHILDPKCGCYIEIIYHVPICTVEMK